MTGIIKDMGKPPSKRVVRVFISSTFTDTVFERNYILEDVIHYLKQVGRERGFDVIFSEMRFVARRGVPPCSHGRGLQPHSTLRGVEP